MYVCSHTHNQTVSYSTDETINIEINITLTVYATYLSHWQLDTNFTIAFGCS